MAREWQSLAIGSIIGGLGSRESEWKTAIRRLTRRVADLRDDLTSPLAVNVVFHVPGEIVRPDFYEPRTGKFSRRDGTVMIQVPLPDIPVPSDVDSVLVRACFQAIDIAERFGIEKGIVNAPLDGLRSLLEDVERSLAADSH